MARITYIEHDGTTHDVEISPGFSIMEAAVRNNVPGIVAECGGACACATCHIYVPDEWLALTSEKSEMEAAMLEYALDVAPNSRLACQIALTEDLDGMIARLPKEQG